MNDNSAKPVLYLGASAIGLGLVANKWVLEALFLPGGGIESTWVLVLVVTIQIVTIGIGVYLLIWRPRVRLPSRNEIVLISLSSALAIALMEVTLRAWLNYLSTPDQYFEYTLFTDTPAEKFRWSPHHYLNYFPTPNYRNGLASHNSLGYRSPEFNPSKSDGIYRIVVLGGSSTYTSGVEDNEQTYPYQLNRLLRETYGYDNIEVINAGVGGYDSWESLINLQFRVLDIEPDLLIVYHGTNDVHTRLVAPDFYRGDNSGRRKQWGPPDIPLIAHSLLARIIAGKLGFALQPGIGAFVNSPTYRGAGSAAWSADDGQARSLLARNPPIYFRRNLMNMASIANAHGVRIAFATWAHSPTFDDYASSDVYQLGYRENNDIVKEVAELSDALLFDFAAVMPVDRRYWADGPHVNEAGALLKASLFADFIHNAGVIEKIDIAE